MITYNEKYLDIPASIQEAVDELMSSSESMRPEYGCLLIVEHRSLDNVGFIRFRYMPSRTIQCDWGQVQSYLDNKIITGWIRRNRFTKNRTQIKKLIMSIFRQHGTEII